MAGFAIAGFAIAGFAMAGLAIAGFNAATIAGLAIAGLAMAGFAMVGLAIAGFAMAGLAIAGLSGSMIAGAVGSGLSVVLACKPLLTNVPPGVVISWTFTVTEAVGFVDWTKIGRDTPAPAETVTSSNATTGPNCCNEADPLGSGVPLASSGWFAIVIRKFFSRPVVFCTVMANMRSSSVVVLAIKPSVFEFPGAATTIPGAMRDV